MKLDKMVLANAFALTTAVLWVVCSAIVWVLPAFSLTVTRWWMHGLDISVMGNWNLTFTNFIVGGVTIVVSTWVTGWLFGWSWEKAGK
jgi:hypothetical protein